MNRSKKPEYQTRLARERIDILLSVAEKEFRKHIERSRRYVELAQKIALRYNVRLIENEKRSFCKKCNTLLKPGVTSQTRLDKDTKTVNVTCLNCKKIYRYPYK
ncbi:MAG: ribonuclease P [Candidatus Aenigmarchaeota archaeon]|nr:ribonuclease P [Candidatus Aenigmarchaeota archaeon]